MPAVERVCADAVPAAQITRLGTGIGLRQDGDDLLFRKPALPHDSSLAKESHYNWIRFRGAGQQLGPRSLPQARSEERRVGKECRSGGGREREREQGGVKEERGRLDEE